MSSGAQPAATASEAEAPAAAAIDRCELTRKSATRGHAVRIVPWRSHCTARKTAFVWDEAMVTPRMRRQRQSRSLRSSDDVKGSQDLRQWRHSRGGDFCGARPPCARHTQEGLVRLAEQLTTRVVSSPGAPSAAAFRPRPRRPTRPFPLGHFRPKATLQPLSTLGLHPFTRRSVDCTPRRRRVTPLSSPLRFCERLRAAAAASERSQRCALVVVTRREAPSERG